MPIFTGVDTGFFFLLEEQNPFAVKIWNESDIVTSVVVLYELKKKLLQGKFAKHPTFINDIRKSLRVVSLSEMIALKSAEISYYMGIPGLDSLILASLAEAGCKTIYTTDEHFELYRKNDIEIINLRNKIT